MAVLGIRNGAKAGNIVSKRKSLNINFLFIELLHKINITFVIMLIFGEKNGTLRVILTI